MNKKKVISIIFWSLIVICWISIFYLERHKNVRKLNDLLEEPIEELNLSMEQKLSDFQYFYDCIISSFPGNTLKEFECRYGISFAEKYNTYRDMIEATTNDLEFYCVMHIIGEEIPSFHTGIAFPDYGYYKTLGCWNIDQVLDTRYIKSKAEFWNNTLRENAKQIVDSNLLSHLFWYEQGQYVADDGAILKEINGIPINEMYDNLSSAKIMYDEFNEKPYRNWIAFYSQPYSQKLFEKVSIKYQNPQGIVEECECYMDKTAQLLTNYSHALGVESKGQLYVKDNPFYSYIDESRDILYLYFTGISNMDMSSASNVIQSANCKNIIIDIRNNPGGDFNVINKYLYPYLYKDNIEVEYVWYMPETKYTKKMTSEWKARRKLNFRDSDYQDVGINGKEQKYRESTKKILLVGGNNSQDYDIYVLISSSTGSAADTFANVLKANDAAILIGTNTGGEGLGSSFLVDYLPESGIVFTYTPELSFNEEGKNNAVYGTAPHYYVQESYANVEEYAAQGEDPYTYQNRLEWDTVLNKAIELIENNK